MMLRWLVALLAVLTFAVVTVITVSHAAPMAAVPNPAPSAHAATAAGMADGEACCPKAGATADHDAHCAFACAPHAMALAGVANAWHPASHAGSYPRLAAGHAPGRTPGLPERPPQLRLLTA